MEFKKMKKNVILVASVLFSFISLTSMASDNKENMREYSNDMSLEKNSNQYKKLNERISFLENENAKRILKDKFEREDAERVYQENLKSLKSK
jgi:hypothetical protein